MTRTIPLTNGTKRTGNRVKAVNGYVGIDNFDIICYNNGSEVI